MDHVPERPRLDVLHHQVEWLAGGCVVHRDAEERDDIRVRALLHEPALLHELGGQVPPLLGAQRPAKAGNGARIGAQHEEALAGHNRAPIRSAADLSQRTRAEHALGPLLDPQLRLLDHEIRIGGARGWRSALHEATLRVPLCVSVFLCLCLDLCLRVHRTCAGGS